ncbi:MAG: shikimate dehydrogenase, partial [Longimicrobiales bacterium]
MSVTSTTRVLTLLGDPVAHSASPELQNAAFRAAGVDGVYVAVRCAPDDLVGFMRGLARAGGGGNVTLPHKEKAATILDVRSEAVRRTGACNTFWGDDEGRVHGDNTDVEGFRRALKTFLEGPTAGIRVLLLGAGGVARAALAALVEDGVGEILLHNRTQERARAVARRIGGQKV